MLIPNSASRLSFVVLLGLLSGCTSNPQPTPPPTASPTAPASAPTAPSTSTPQQWLPAAAEIAEIQQQPVFVRLVNQSQEQPGKEGMGLNVGDSIRTEDKALAQIDLNNGLAFRLGGNAVLTLKPDNRLNLTSGDMITWVTPGQKVPAEIVTPSAIAGIRGTTVFVKIPANAQEGTLFFAWEGTVSVRLPGQTEELLLKTAEEVRIKPGERDLQAIRRRVRRLPREEWRKKRRTDRLLRAFKTRMSTLSIIEQVKPGQVIPDLPQNSPTPQNSQQQN